MEEHRNRKKRWGAPSFFMYPNPWIPAVNHSSEVNNRNIGVMRSSPISTPTRSQGRVTCPLTSGAAAAHKEKNKDGRADPEARRKKRGCLRRRMSRQAAIARGRPIERRQRI
jgi:hypothetical protein